MGLLGKNGAGKTTTFYMVVGLVVADDGQIRLDGQDITHMPIYKRARMGLSYLPQEASVFRKLSVEDNVRAILELQEGEDGKPLSKDVIEERLDQLLEELQIQHLRTNQAISLSGGERRRTEIARALAAAPAIILADEPTGNLDSENTRLMGDLFRDLHRAQGCAFVLVTHAPDVAMWADRVVVLKDGSIVDDRSTAEFAGPAELSSFYERTLNDAL